MGTDCQRISCMKYTLISALALAAIAAAVAIPDGHINGDKLMADLLTETDLDSDCVMGVDCGNGRHSTPPPTASPTPTPTATPTHHPTLDPTRTPTTTPTDCVMGVDCGNGAWGVADLDYGDDDDHFGVRRSPTPTATPTPACTESGADLGTSSEAEACNGVICCNEDHSCEWRSSSGFYTCKQ